MTSPGTAPASNGPDTLRLTSYELTTLFHVATTSEAQRTRAAIRLPEVASDSPILAASLSSLVLRGLAEDHGGRLVPVGVFAGLANVLLTATRWVEVVVSTERARQGAVIVGSPQGNALLEALPSRVWQATPLTPETPLEETAAGLVAAAFRVHPDRPFAGVVSMTDGDEARTVAARVEADGTWSLGRGTESVGAPEPVEPDLTFRFLVTGLS